jgi:hypothetical protein
MNGIITEIYEVTKEMLTVTKEFIHKYADKAVFNSEVSGWVWTYDNNGVEYVIIMTKTTLRVTITSTTSKSYDWHDDFESIWDDMMYAMDLRDKQDFIKWIRIQLI